MFSIVMLTWNNHDTFKRCITSMTPLILDERVEEVIILDNGSHEISLQKLLQSTEKNYNKIRVIYSSENLGIAKGRKYLFDLCKGEYILSFDSDVVIVNAQLFLENFLKAINLKDMWLVGGGGGNHVFFPTIFRSDINNLPSPKSPHEVTVVDEVAGWFQGFKSSRLKKNGGPLYMDERFSPFWGEDSDFCYQIKLLGGKCCILGHGNLGHAWSSCDKKENHKSIETMWKKMTDKWYPTFGKIYQIDFDETFYKDNYPKFKDSIDVKEKFLLEGMRLGHIINKNHIKEFFDVKFKNNTSLVYEDKEMHTLDFVDNYFTRDNIIKNNYKVVIDKLRSDNKNAFFLFINNINDGMNYIKKELVKIRSSPVIIITSKNISHHVEKILSQHFTNYYLAEFTNYYDHMIPFIIAMQETRNHKFDKVIKLSMEIEITSNINFEKVKDNLLGVDLTFDYLRFKPTEYYSQKGLAMDHENILKIVDSFPVKELLNLTLRYPTEYSYNISPRFCPRLSLDKVFNQLENHSFKNKSLVLYLTKIEDSDQVKDNINKLKESGNCQVVILNIGMEKFWSVEELNYDYYYVLQEQEFVYFNYFAILNIIHLFDYSNIIFFNDNIVIEEKIEEFFNHSYYHNISFLKTNDELNINLLSLTEDDLMPFASMTKQIYDMSLKIIEENKNLKENEKKKDEINVLKTIDINAQRNFGMRYLWFEKREENEKEISLEYNKMRDKFTPDEDFPLTFEN